VYLKTGLDPDKTHNIKIVVTGEKNPNSRASTIGHIAFEYSAESYKASAGFCSVMGKENWNYQQRRNTGDVAMKFLLRDDVFVKEWCGEGGSRIGNDYQIPGENADSVRKWIAPHGGVVRIEGRIVMDEKTSDVVSIRLEHNGTNLFEEKNFNAQTTYSQNITAKVEQGDAISFVVAAKAGSDGGKVSWDPVITYTESVPEVWTSNPPGDQNLALHKYTRSKVLVFAYQPFNAVDGNDNTPFAIYADDALSSGDEWLQVDLDKKCTIDRYVIMSHPEDVALRPATFTLQRSDDGFEWTDFDSVSNNTSERVDRTIKPFTARYVRLHLPNGKPFSISEFALYYGGNQTGGHTRK
jgi:hypothetical protein